MNGRKNGLVVLGFVLTTILMASAISVLIASCHYSRLSFQLINAICGEVLKQIPEGKNVLLVALEESIEKNDLGGLTGGDKGRVPAYRMEEEEAGTKSSEDLLSTLGYHPSDFFDLFTRKTVLYAAAGFLSGTFLFMGTFWYRNKKEAVRIQALAEYLEQVNTGKGIILSTSGEDDFSKLEDEIYKTVTFLYQTKDAALQARNGFAENLSNIAHQIKTPLTALSLSVQMMKQDFHGTHLEQMEKQILRLTRLEEALLMLSRIDAGTIELKENEVDVFTILTLVAENLQELFLNSGVTIDIPELGEMMIVADLDWTMEALMNLMKNCMEHSAGGTVHCCYGQNPLYTEILIWDDGKGFAKKDLPHLFERFYRGQHAREEGIGIGLALAKEIIERQNGTIRAQNRPEGGALFEIRFYCH